MAASLFPAAYEDGIGSPPGKQMQKGDNRSTSSGAAVHDMGEGEAEQRAPPGLRRLEPPLMRIECDTQGQPRLSAPHGAQERSSNSRERAGRGGRSAAEARMREMEG